MEDTEEIENFIRITLVSIYPEKKGIVTEFIGTTEGITPRGTKNKIVLSSHKDTQDKYNPFPSYALTKEHALKLADFIYKKCKQ